jgi:hypothetical protein
MKINDLVIKNEIASLSDTSGVFVLLAGGDDIIAWRHLL